MTRDRTRRRLLGIVAGSTPLLAGCSDSNEVQDSDGDGVIDSEDYAPKDPSVQAKSDARDVAPVSSPTPTATPTATSTSAAVTTPTAGDAAAGRVSVDGSNLEDRTYVASYSTTDVEVRVRSHPTIDLDRAKLLAVAYVFPRGEGRATGTSESFTPPGEDEDVQVTIEYDTDALAEDTRYHHLLFAMPADTAPEDASSSDLTHLYETDPFRVRDGQIEVDEPEYLPADADQSGFTRTNRPGFFSLAFEGTTKGKGWSLSFIIWKSAYATARDEPRGRSYGEYVSLANRNGFAGELATLLNDDAEANGFTGKREKVDLVIDFVQGLPYVPDDVSTGYDDYPKMLQETIVEAGGDCEDTAILLAAVLQAEPFGYDTVLIQPPEHMAAGIYGTDLPGTYWEYDGRRYYYIETTGESWGIGDIPDQYREADAYVHQV